MRQIPTLESASPTYARLAKRLTELQKRVAENRDESRRLHAEQGSEQAQDRHTDRVAALLTGVDYSPPAPIRERMAALATEERALEEAIRSIAGQISIERREASRVVTADFEAERQEMAERFFRHVAEAAAIHAEYGEMRVSFHRAGVDPAGFHDFGIELFGDPGHRNGHVGIEMRAAAKRGYLPNNSIPEAYR